MNSQVTGLSPRKDKILQDIYYNPSNSASLGSKINLLNAAKRINPSFTLDQVNNWLSQQQTYTLHKPRRNTFQRNIVIAEDVDEQFQADIVDMRLFEKSNDGFKYILTAVDVLSRFAFAVPVKDKSGRSIKQAFEKIFKERMPQRIQTDKGLEFLNVDVQNLFKRYNIQFFTSVNEEIKCSIVERFNRTLKSKIWKYFTAYQTKKWIDILDDILHSYNTAIHRITKFRPSHVNEHNAKTVFKNSYGYEDYRDYLKSLSRKLKFKPGDIVRIPQKKSLFDKGYSPLWTKSAYEIKKSIKGIKQPIHVVSINNREKKLYPPQIQKINLPYHKIEKILRTREINGEVEYLVEWSGYPVSYYTWEKSEVLKNYKDGSRN